MKVLICVDVDGTLETSNGPVKTDRLKALDQTEGCRVVIVSPSSARPQGFVVIADLSRKENLERAKQVFPSELCLYVSDNGDIADAQAAGFTYIDRGQFV